MTGFSKLEHEINQLISKQYAEEIYSYDLPPETLQDKTKFIYQNIDTILKSLRVQHKIGFNFFMRCIDFVKTKP